MADNKWEQPSAPPPPLFLNKKERDLVKQVNDELVERIIGQQILYYAIDIRNTNFHPLYGEAVEKTFLPPVRVFALIDWEGLKTETDKYGLDVTTSLTIHFHKRRLTEDQEVFVREGDFVQYGEHFYEILSLVEPKWLFGQVESKFEIAATCVRAREGLFNV